MKKLFFMLMLFVFFTGISFAGIVTVDTTDLINDPQHDKILPKIDANFTDLDDTKLDVDLIPFVYQYYIEDLTTAITTGTKKYVIRAPHAMTVTSVRGSANFAATGGPGIIIDINEDNTTILSTKLYIDSTEKTSTTAGSTAVISDASIADDAEITIDFDQVGSTVSGSGIVITIAGTRAI